MTKKANPKLIGAFVLGAVALAAIGLVIFGSGKFFAEKHNYVLFFPGSLKGLTVGAPVTLEGVPVGTVTDLKVVFNRETLKFFTPVYIDVLPDRIKDVGEYLGTIDLEEAGPAVIIKALIERGLRGQLDMQSLLTGKLQVALSVHPGSQVHYARIDTRVPEIPTLPTTMQQLAKALEKIDLEGMATDIRDAVAAVKKLVTSPELEEAVTSLNKTLKDFGKLARNVDSRVGPLTTSIEETLGDARTLMNNVDAQVEPTFADLQRALNSADIALKQAKVTLASVDKVIGEDSAIMWELYNTLLQLQSMARQVNGLVSMLQRQPDSIIRGKSSLGR
ncbi:MAG: MlaD family protein [Syntrophobacteria bacterium]|jgi:paraquat-inducible protein B